MRRADPIVALLLLGGAVILVREAARLPVGWTTVGPGAGFFPFWLALGVTLCAGILVWQTVRAPAAATNRAFIPAKAWKPLLIVFLPMVAVVALIRTLGIYLGGGLYLAGYMTFVGRHRWPLVLAISVLVPLALFFTFERWFLLLLPKGTILESLLYRR